MGCKVAIHQPNYLPWIGYFHKMCECDIFVFLDSVQFTKNCVQNRNSIKTSNGPLLLTVPVLQKKKFGQLTNEVEINNTSNWSKKHWDSIFLSYKKAPHFAPYSDKFKQVYSRKWDNLVELNLELINLIMAVLGIEKQAFLSSELDCEGSGTDLLLNICKKLSGTVYLSGVGGKKYLEEDKFADSGVELRYQEFHHPVYRQLYGDFIPNLSVIDLIFNNGKSSVDIIQSLKIT